MISGHFRDKSEFFREFFEGEERFKTQKIRRPRVFWSGDFPGDLVVKASPSNARDAGSIPGRGAKIPHASRPEKHNINRKRYCNEFNKDFKKMVHIKKKS